MSNGIGTLWLGFLCKSLLFRWLTITKHKTFTNYIVSSTPGDVISLHSSHPNLTRQRSLTVDPITNTHEELPPPPSNQLPRSSSAGELFDGFTFQRLRGDRPVPLFYIEVATRHLSYLSNSQDNSQSESRICSIVMVVAKVKMLYISTTVWNRTQMMMIGAHLTGVYVLLSIWL